jgi:hypothetical protein
MPIGANMFHLKPESDCAPECNIIEELWITQFSLYILYFMIKIWLILASSKEHLLKWVVNEACIDLHSVTNSV